MRAHEVLEQKWAEFNQVDPTGMVACSSGTAALHLALEALRLPQGSQVIVPDFAMISCARAVTMAGLEPVFVDCGDDLNMDLTLPEMGPGVGGVKNVNTSAMMAVHVYGRRVDMHEFHQAAEPRGLAVVEDLAEAHGILPHKDTDVACWSFYRNKIVAGEEGGAVWFRDPNHAKLARQLRNVGFTDAHDYTHVPRGHNYRMSDVHARYILADNPPCSANGLSFYERNLRTRRECEALYDRACPDEWRMPHRDAPWVYDIRVPKLDGWRQGNIVASLNSDGIEARRGFKPLSSQVEYINHRTVRGARWQAIYASQEVIYLPMTKDSSRRAVEIFDTIAARAM